MFHDLGFFLALYIIFLLGLDFISHRVHVKWGVPIVVISIQYRLYCSMRNSDKMIIGKLRPTLVIQHNFNGLVCITNHD